jgi:gliding motility-associated-like protein
VPNIFSPNEDGKNDFLTIHTLGIKDFYIRIFDRWGNEMFQSNDVSQSWDGRFNGRSVDPGVYMIMIEYTDQDTEEKFVKYFDLALIR